MITENAILQINDEKRTKHRRVFAIQNIPKGGELETPSDKDRINYLKYFVLYKYISSIYKPAILSHV